MDEEKIECIECGHVMSVLEDDRDTIFCNNPDCEGYYVEYDRKTGLTVE